MSARLRIAALLEVLGVYLAGQLVTTLLIRMLGLPIANPLDDFTAGISNTELITATRQLFVLLLLQYAGYFLLIIPINWWHRRRGPAAYGLTRAGRSWTALLLAGVATVAAVALVVWPASALLMLDALYHLGLGETVAWRQALFDTSWRRWEFWLFTAVLSWALIPVAEELFFRGYCQRRLAEDWGDGPAIIGTALLFHLRSRPVPDAERLQRMHGREPAHARARVRGGVRLDPIADSVDGSPRPDQLSDDAGLGAGDAGRVGDRWGGYEAAGSGCRQARLLERQSNSVCRTRRAGDGVGNRGAVD
jgi:membrane protease YdiL (CAAX protease family)